MQVIGFNFTNISGEKSPDFKQSPINIQIEFTNVEKEKVELLKDLEAVKLSFKFTITYAEQDEQEDKKEKEEPKESPKDIQAEVTFKGLIVLSVTKQQAKDFQKAWKKNQVPPETVVSLHNIILKKCSIKALQLEEDLNLPAHMPFPQVRTKEES
tara:strand:- start:2029 stop:2493 length:465 start_codon:yes stop_codon:yes gene_type:complete